MEGKIELCKYCSPDNPVKYCTDAAHITARQPELCPYCVDVEMAQCTTQAHWDRRLKSYNLPTSDGVDHAAHNEIRIGDETVERLVPLTGIHETIVDLNNLPDGWHNVSSGDVEARHANTTYADLNIYERSPAPKYNSAGYAINKEDTVERFMGRVRDSAQANLLVSGRAMRTGRKECESIMSDCWSA